MPTTHRGFAPPAAAASTVQDQMARLGRHGLLFLEALRPEVALETLSPQGFRARGPDLRDTTR